ncbi:glycosyl hydrolase [Sinomonas albida]|uniref:glycosyl hydrolase n=1 Tax=Sinomonas albida TaxID=369942 RepID=UPI00301B4E8D
MQREPLDMDFNELWQGFLQPPDEARPRAWWHWMDGNVDLKGITQDLEWLAEVGVRGVQQFDGGMGTPQVVPERVVNGSPAWREAVRHAVSEADRLGLEFAAATSPGWSAAGGPWVQKADAMQKIVWSETTIEGNRAVEEQLAALPDVAGLYQDLPRWGSDRGALRFVRDWLTIAFPATDDDGPLAPAQILACAPIGDAGCLFDGSYATSVSLPRDPDGESEAWIEQVFDHPVEAASVTVALPGPSGFGSAPPAHARLEASDDGATYRVIAEGPPTSVPIRTVSFPRVTATRFRLVLSGGSAADALPKLAAGVKLPPVLRKADSFEVSEFSLWPTARVHHAELKAGFGAAEDYYALEHHDEADRGAIDPSAVVDLTGHVDEAGTLRWDAPPGNWRIMRFGASLTGQTNGPAMPEATGLEVDKLDSAKVRRYLDAYYARYDEALEGLEQGGLDALLSDSIESGPQNATPRLRERFRELRGYDLVSWAACLAGRVVESPTASDRFLFDFRRTISDLISSDYYGCIARFAHERGLSYYAEALEDKRPQLGDDLAMRSHADVPMGAMWLFDPGVGQPQPTYVADLKGASSVAHVYGKPFTGAESMTAFHRPWSYTPRRLKHIADLELALGVTRFCIHTSAHQPSDSPPPGIALAPFLGQSFTRHETWGNMASPWIDYLARCSFVLNQGTPAADVVVFIGEEAPVTGLWAHSPDTTVPDGVGFDYISLDGLERFVEIRDGLLAARGAQYRALILGGSSRRMTVRALRRLLKLTEEGATVIGERPEASPSLGDDNAEFEALCERLWSPPPGLPGVIAGLSLGETLTGLGVAPQIKADDGGSLLTLGRRFSWGELLFVANPEPSPCEAIVRSALPLTRWDPVTGTRTPLPPASEAGAYRLSLYPCGSALLVQEPHADPGEARGDRARWQREGAYALDGPWELKMPCSPAVCLPDGPSPWTDLGFRGFSGTGVYSTVFELPEGSDRPAHRRRRVLELGDVGDIARVTVNGVDCGVAWTWPFEVLLGDAVQPGPNTLEVEVANAWMNRLIAEAAAPTGELFAPDTTVYEPSAEAVASGLLGPVRLRSEVAVDE